MRGPAATRRCLTEEAVTALQRTCQAWCVVKVVNGAAQ
jgi:hypothetical protein